MDVDWRSSRLSALPLMCRTAFAAVALAMFAWAGVASAQATQSARTQRRSAAAGTARAAHRQAPIRGAAVQARNHSSGSTSNGSTRISAGRMSAGRTSAGRTSGGRKLTPDEAGRLAGLAIRQQLERRQMGRSAASVRVGRSLSARRLRLERISLRSRERSAGPESEPGEAGTAYRVPEIRQQATDEDQVAESRRMDEAREQLPGDAEESADVEATPADRAAPAQSAARRELGTAAKDDEDAKANAASQNAAASGAGEDADAATGRTNAEDASILMPRGGMPASLRGSLASLQRQNDRLDAEGLERIENEADLAARIADKLLVPIPVSIALTVNAELEENHRYCRPWTAKFLADLARAHEAAFHSALEVSSAVRTVEYQKRLERINGNAAPAEGDLVSPHLTGATIDIAKKGLSRAEMAWMRKQLAGLEAAGKIDVEEEFKQACFHITVYKNYAAAGKAGPATPAKPATHSTTPRQTAEQADEAQGA